MAHGRLKSGSGRQDGQLLPQNGQFRGACLIALQRTHGAGAWGEARVFCLLQPLPQIQGTSCMDWHALPSPDEAPPTRMSCLELTSWICAAEETQD
jgi:hypothetical protein